LADGGEGSIDIFDSFPGVTTILSKVNNPLGDVIDADYRVLRNRAYIEMSRASGLNLISPSNHSALYSSTFGTGQLILDAIKKDCTEIFLFIGGSATTDGGIGMANALGYRFLDQNGKDLQPIGINLQSIDGIEKPGNLDLNDIKFTTICDVTNPLFGPNGAAQVYAAQKGANSNGIKILDDGLRNLSKIIEKDLGMSIGHIPGSGAAGGLGAGTLAFLNATLESGIAKIMELTDFENVASDADLLITGEGKSDSQSLKGKVISGVSEFAKQHDIPLGLLVGMNQLSVNEEKELGLHFLNDVLSSCSNLEDSLSKALQILETLSCKAIEKFITNFKV